MTTTVTRALRSEGVIRNGQEEKDCPANRQEIPEGEGRQIGQEVDSEESEEAGCQEVTKEEGFKVKEAGCPRPGASAREPRRLRLRGVLTSARRRAR